MNNTPENPEAEQAPGFNLNFQMPEKVPVVMNGQDVAQMFEATRAFVEDCMKSEIELISDPETGADLPIVRSPDGRIDVFPLSHFDEANGAPRFRRGEASFGALESFIAHINRFGDNDSAVFVDEKPNRPSLLSVLDYHRADDAITSKTGQYRFGWHRGSFEFPLSEEWKAWTSASEDPMNMVEFSQFIEDRAGDIDAFDDGAIPDSLLRFVEKNGGRGNIASFGQLLELSRGLKVNENANIEQAINLATGEGQIRFASEHSTSVKVPTMFFVAIPIFKRGAFYRLGVDLRYRKTNAGLTFTVRLHRPDVAFNHAMSEAVNRVANETKAQIFYGHPENEPIF